MRGFFTPGTYYVVPGVFAYVFILFGLSLITTNKQKCIKISSFFRKCFGEKSLKAFFQCDKLVTVAYGCSARVPATRIDDNRNEVFKCGLQEMIFVM